MSDELDKVNTNEDDSKAKDQPDENQVKISKDEYDKLILGNDRLSKLDNLAGEANMDHIEDYLSAVEDKAFAEPTTKDNKVDDDPNPEGSDKKEPTTGLDDVTRQQIDQSSQHALQSLLESQWSLFKTDKLFNKPDVALPEYDRKQLTSVIQRDKNLVAEVARNFEGNAFLAAEHILNLRHGMEEASKKGAKSAEALKKAGDTANLPTDGPTGTPENKTIADRIAEQNQKTAEKIAPNTDYVYDG